MPQVYQSSRDIPPGSSVDSEGRVFRIGTQEQIGILPQTVREAERAAPITPVTNEPPVFNNVPTPTELPPLTQFSFPTIPTPQAPPFDLRPVPVLSSEPARQEATDLRTSLADLSSQATRAFETGEAERQTFEARRQAASEQALKTQQEQLRATAEEQISEREQLGRNRLRAFEAMAASMGATRTSAALLDLGAIERENQRDIQGIQRDLNLALSQAQQAALERDLQGARANMQQAQALRDQLFARQQQAFENRTSIEKLEDQRQAEDFARKQAVANFELNTREFEDKQVQQAFNNAMVQANFELEQLRAQQGTQRLNVEQIQQVYDNRLKQAQLDLQTQQQAVELGLKTVAEQRLEAQLQQTGIDKTTDNARQAIATVLNTFGGADLKNIPQEMKDKFGALEVQAGLPAGFITQGLETLKEKATEQQKQLAEEKLKDKNTQDEFTNTLKLLTLQQRGAQAGTTVNVTLPSGQNFTVGGTLKPKSASGTASGEAIVSKIISSKPGDVDYDFAYKLAYGQITPQFFATVLRGYKQEAADRRLGIYELATKINPYFDEAAFEQGISFGKSPKTQLLLAAVTTVQGTVNSLRKASADAERTRSPLINKLLLEAQRKGLGSLPANTFNVLSIIGGDELSLVLGSGSATDMARQLGLTLTDTSFSDAQFQQAMDIIEGRLEQRKSSIQQQIWQGINPKDKIEVKSLEDLAKEKGFRLEAAKEAKWSDFEIRRYLEGL